MDAFYASVEQRDNEALRGRPVAVGHSGRRGVVAAASYEARVFGIRSAMPSATAQLQCPALVFVPPRMEIYRAVSRQIHAILSDYSVLLEPLSLDEAYLDVTANQRRLPSAAATAHEIRTRIHAQTGLTASAGISYNKFLAKLASDHRKPNGQYVITPAIGQAFVEALPVRKFHGVGPVTAEKMHGLGIRTGADLKDKSPGFLKHHFGKAGAWYHAIARAEDDRLVKPDRPRKSTGSETTFSRDLTDSRTIETEVLSRADEVWVWCARAQRFGRTVTVKVRFGDFRQITRSRTLPRRVASKDLLFAVSVDLLRTVFPPNSGVRLVGVTISNFDEPDLSEAEQLDFGL
jgi:DNA polymerase-4